MGIDGESSGKPALLVRVAAKLKGEVRADTLESFRRAGGVAYGEMQNAETLRQKLAADGANLWHVEPGISSQLLCSWNAFVLQSIGEHLLDADYAADPRTAGYVPPVTHTQVSACFDQVEAWTSRARQAAGNDTFAVGEVVRLPADLPEWAEADPCPLPHLRGMLAATRAIREHAEVALGTFENTVQDTDEHGADLRRLRQLAADAATAADYAEGLLEADPEPRLHEAIEQRLQRALESYHHLGQLTAMPALIAGYESGEIGAVAPQQQTPKSPSFDPWCLTSPRERAKWRKDPRARQSVKELWEFDPAPAATLRIQAEIDAAKKKGAIDYAKDANGKLLGSYYCCPWGAVYVVRRPVTISGRRLRQGQQFTYEVDADEVPKGGAFVRRLMIGKFSPTDDIQYCDPDGEHEN
ncbi:hypothetical protein [Actinomadura verrucosospora]|uniref:Uncharacterized protein n=1 Tax=Actinomadura verrucosospora TaxID=46165 RepID=A0A7D3W1S5_ACTVE|nr:hypothetical protein [Actinomadura verrucosospora]QKG24272.1 hypothetical protein ACTIVE_5915 [Actinomadura verrucosospora]